MSTVQPKDLLKLRLGRETLQRWINEPELEEIISGCFVRILVGERSGQGRLYRICMVTGISVNEKYKFGDIQTDKHLVLEYGNVVKMFKMDYVSNADFTDDEFADWAAHMKKCGRELLTVADVDRKVRKIREYVEQKKNRDERGSSVDERDAKRRRVDDAPVAANQPVDGESYTGADYYRFYYALLDKSQELKKRQKEIEDKTEAARKLREVLQRDVDDRQRESHDRQRGRDRERGNLKQTLREVERRLEKAQAQFEEQAKKHKHELDFKENSLHSLREKCSRFQQEYDEIINELERDRRGAKRQNGRKENAILDVQFRIEEIGAKTAAQAAKISDQRAVIATQDELIDLLNAQLKEEAKLQILINSNRRKQAELLASLLKDGRTGTESTNPGTSSEI